MLNLSDKDLDRLSQEAAQQYEPADVGPRLWEKLEARLDRDLGKVNPNPARGIRRLPYYYAPALLVILGLGYYLVRLNSKSPRGMPGSPPFAVAKQAPANPTAINPAPAAEPNPSNSTTKSTRPDKSNSTSTQPSGTARYPSATGTAHAPATATGSTVPSSAGVSAPASTVSSSAGASRPATVTGGVDLPHSSSTHLRRHAASGLNPRTKPGRDTRDAVANNRADDAVNRNPNAAAGNITASAAASPAPANRAPREYNYTTVRGPVHHNRIPAIDDSALRAFRLASLQDLIQRKGGLHINRSLIFGLQGAPDFASVNSVAGDRAGSSIGLTVDYQFAPHWYLGSGLLFSRKVFAAAPQDYHVPQNYYFQNGMGMGGSVEWIKGRFNMLEVPLNLRYDFSTTGNTLFFAGVGTSSYLFTSENCGYYYEFYSRIASKNFSYGGNPNYLFSTLNLSMGVETGISNSLSVLISPYVKIPTRNIGFGQVQLNSFGIDFALHFAPVIGRKRW